MSTFTSSKWLSQANTSSCGCRFKCLCLVNQADCTCLPCSVVLYKTKREFPSSTSLCMRYRLRARWRSDRWREWSFQSTSNSESWHESVKALLSYSIWLNSCSHVGRWWRDNSPWICHYEWCIIEGCKAASSSNQQRYAVGERITVLHKSNEKLTSPGWFHSSSQ